jgi:transposase
MGAKPERAPVWQERVERWRASGLKSKEFAAREGINCRSLVWWDSEFRRRGALANTSSTESKRPAFVPVATKTTKGAVGASIELVLASGHRLRVDKGFDAETLRRLLAVVGADK